MRRWKDPFPPTPRGFHDRVEQTLHALEDMDRRQNRRYKKLTAALVAALVALLAVGAVAAVIGNNQLKRELSDSGATDMAERVQDVHLADASDGFGFSIDEVAWEGDDLYISYTMSVPEDGNTYLVGLMQPTINGEPVNYRSSRYMDDLSGMAAALGGDYPATDTVVLPVLADSRELELKDMELSVSAAFFSTDRPLEYIPDFFDAEGEYNHPELLVHWDGGVIEQEIYPSADTLYYWWISESGTPMIDLSMFPEVLTAMAAEDAEEKGHVTVTYDAEGWPQTGLTPAGLDSTGVATLVTERSLSLPLSEDMVSHDLYNGLEEDTFRYRDMTIVIEDFHMTHFQLTARIWMLPDENVPEDVGADYFDRFPGMEFRVNGKNLADGFFGGIEAMKDGVLCYREDYRCDDYIPLGNLESLELVACRWDEETREKVVGEVVAELRPILDTAAAEEEARALALREAAGSWQPGDPDITVWATDRGTYYHLERECSGMREPHEWAIADAVAAGKAPCPACAGGKNAPFQWEEGEDISCGAH